MDRMVLCIILLGLFLGVDCYLYCTAKFPERTGHWWSHLPGGGVVARVKYGKKNRK